MQDGEVTAEKLADDLRRVIADAEELLRATAGEAGAAIAAARARMQDRLESAKSGLGPLGAMRRQSIFCKCLSGPAGAQARRLLNAVPN